MLVQSAVELYKILRLRNYQDMFVRIKEKDGSLSATEAFAVDVIYLLGAPTISYSSNISDFVLKTNPALSDSLI